MIFFAVGLAVAAAATAAAAAAGADYVEVWQLGQCQQRGSPFPPQLGERKETKGAKKKSITPCTPVELLYRSDGVICGTERFNLRKQNFLSFIHTRSVVLPKFLHLLPATRDPHFHL